MLLHGRAFIMVYMDTDMEIEYIGGYGGHGREGAAQTGDVASGESWRAHYVCRQDKRR